MNGPYEVTFTDCENERARQVFDTKRDAIVFALALDDCDDIRIVDADGRQVWPAINDGTGY